MEKKWKEGEKQAASDIFDCMTGFRDHFSSNQDSFAATAEDDEENRGQTAKENAESQPEMFVCSYGSGHSFETCQENIIFDFSHLI